MPESDFEALIQANRRNWNERTALHVRSQAYDLEGFIAGRTGAIPEDEQAEVGAVDGKDLLHLQCHFGKDTLAWARLGARVTGVDIADEAIAVARSLADQVHLSARFIQANVLDLATILDDRFDIVYASYGVLVWIADIRSWARIAAHFLKPGGIFYLAEGHPLLWILDDARPVLAPEVSYFGSSEPTRFEKHGSYTGDEATFSHPATYQWQHSLGDIVSAITAAGLQIEFLHEFPWTAYRRFPTMREGADGRWHLPGDTLPLTFSIRARRPAG